MHIRESVRVHASEYWWIPSCQFVGHVEFLTLTVLSYNFHVPTTAYLMKNVHTLVASFSSRGETIIEEG